MIVDNQQSKIAPHVHYEWQMLRRVAQKLISGKYEDDVEKYGLLEVFLLHARNLIEFFFTTSSSHKEAVSVMDFFEKESDWNLKLSKQCPYLCKKLSQMHSDLAHISYLRLKRGNGDSEKYGWNIEKIENELNCVWQLFYTALSEERKQWFHAHEECKINSTSVRSSTVLRLNY